MFMCILTYCGIELGMSPIQNGEEILRESTWAQSSTHTNISLTCESHRTGFVPA
jgi:hypothetical protein